MAPLRCQKDYGEMKQERRWLQSVVAASQSTDVRLPWHQRKLAKRAKPVVAPVTKATSLAAR